MKMAMKQLSCKSFAKLNLCLHVINRRDDGYHDIQGIFHVIDLYDTIIFRMNNGNSVNLYSRDKNLINNDNLIHHACRILSLKYNLKIGIDITLEKKIPLGSGLGGGVQTLQSLCTLSIDYMTFNWQKMSCLLLRIN